MGSNLFLPCILSWHEMIGESVLRNVLIGARHLGKTQCMHQPIEIQIFPFLTNQKQVPSFRDIYE